MPETYRGSLAVYMCVGRGRGSTGMQHPDAVASIGLRESEVLCLVSHPPVRRYAPSRREPLP